MKEVQFTKELFDQKVAEGWLFINDKVITRLPTDWIDAVGYLLHAQQHVDDDNPFVIMLDERQTKKFVDFCEKDDINLLIYNTEKHFMWECAIIKNDKNEVFFLGGENLRKFCDEKNIFYESHYATNEENKELLMSFSNLKFLKNEGEDCRKPIEKEEVERRIKNCNKAKKKKS